MRQVMVRYKLKPGRTAENEALVRAVYEELHQTRPEGLRYATFKLEDGVTFVHLAVTDGDGSPLPDLAAFQEFQKEIADRCEERPVASRLVEIGSYP